MMAVLALVTLCLVLSLTVAITCNKGYYVNHNKECRPCWQGTYCPDGKKKKPCFGNTYADKEGMVACDECPKGTIREQEAYYCLPAKQEYQDGDYIKLQRAINWGRIAISSSETWYGVLGTTLPTTSATMVFSAENILQNNTRLNYQVIIEDKNHQLRPFTQGVTPPIMKDDKNPMLIKFDIDWKPTDLQMLIGLETKTNITRMSFEGAPFTTTATLLKEGKTNVTIPAGIYKRFALPVFDPDSKFDRIDISFPDTMAFGGDASYSNEFTPSGGDVDYSFMQDEVMFIGQVRHNTTLHISIFGLSTVEASGVLQVVYVEKSPSKVINFNN